MNASKVALASALLALLVLPVAAYAASNTASNSLVKFYSDKASYLPNSKIKLTVEFAEPFTGTVLIQIKGPNGKVIDMVTVNLRNATMYTYVFQHTDAYGYGTFQAALTYSGYVVINGQQSTVFTTKPLVISFTVAPAYSIKGRVVDQNGMPIEGATVVVKETGASTVTDANGTFVLPVPGPGRYTVCAKKVDYLKNMTTVDVTQFGVTTLKKPIVLTSQAYAIMKLMDQMKMVNATLKSLVTSVASLTDKYNAVSNTLQEVASMLQKLEQNTTMQAKEVKALQQQLSMLAGQIAALQKSVNETMMKISDLENMLGNYATKDYVNTQLADLKNMLQQLQGQLQQLQQQLSSLQSQAATKDEAKQYAQQAASQVKQEIMSELEAKISDVNKKIAGLEDKVSKLQSQVNNLQQSLLQQLTSQLNKVTEQLNKVTNNANSASRWALVAVAIAIIGIILAIFVAIKVMKLTAA